MSTIEIIILSIGLAMDSCTMAICLGMKMNKFYIKKAIYIGFWFGLFQAGMPLIGYLLGNTFADMIDKIDHFIAFFVLSLIGINMIRENDEQYSITKKDFTTKGLIILAIATSIDALAVGITFSFLNTNIQIAISCIGLITFLLSVLGTKLGNSIAKKLAKNGFEKCVSILGGVILIGMGFKILIQHLGILSNLG